MTISRRNFLATAASLPAAHAAGRKYLIDWTHLFGEDRKRFPYHQHALYQPPPKSVETYAAFVRDAKIDHCIIVHSEVYQDDHRYLEYCFEHEPSPGFFRATCLFDPTDSKTPARIKEIDRRYPRQIIGMRINVQNDRNTPPSTAGGVRDRDMHHPNMKKTWAMLADLGLCVDMQAIPCHAPAIAALKAGFRDMPVHIDHYGQPDRGTAAEFDQVLKLAKLPNVYMHVEPLGGQAKSSGNRWYGNSDEIVRKVHSAFGADHLIWSSLGGNMKTLETRMAAFEQMYSFVSDADREKIRGLNTMKLFKFPM